MEYKQKVGKFGEDLAVQFLVRKGYFILAKNIKTSWQEIDILAKIKDKYVFLEVKTRILYSNKNYEEVLSQRKINNLKRAIGIYINNSNLDLNNARADLIIVEIDKRKKIANIKHYIDIF